MPETITSRDAARFPIVASCTLLGLYLFFKVSTPQERGCSAFRFTGLGQKAPGAPKQGPCLLLELRSLWVVWGRREAPRLVPGLLGRAEEVGFIVPSWEYLNLQPYLC